MNNTNNNARIAKNTLMLYMRMIFVMFVSLYTVRVVLNALGAENYGLYNVIGGVVVLFSFLTSTLASASQRYFAFEIGRNDYKKLNKVFSLTLILYFIAGFIIVILGETIGLWFIKTKMTIPDGSMRSAVLIYQFSIISFVFSIITSPFQALIIAQEKMNIYAWVGIIEAILKLSVAFLFKYLPIDKLIAYGLMVMISHIVVNSIYIIYCRIKYSSSKFVFYWNKQLANEIVSYSGWNMYGGVANVIRSQGINILVNIFFNPIVNAARGIAFQISTAINSFASNFYTAVRPQITKYYAQEDIDSTIRLVFSSSKFSFYLLLLLSTPIIIFRHEILDLWLVDIPEYTEIFTLLVIVNAMIDSLSNPLMTLVQATGKVKQYQLIVGTIIILNLPFSYLFLSLGYGAEITMVISILISIILLIVRIIILKKIMTFPLKDYFANIICRIVATSLMTSFFSYMLKKIFVVNEPNFSTLIIFVVISVLLTGIAIVIIGLSNSERNYILSLIKKKMAK